MGDSGSIPWKCFACELWESSNVLSERGENRGPRNVRKQNNIFSKLLDLGVCVYCT